MTSGLDHGIGGHARGAQRSGVLQIETILRAAVFVCMLSGVFVTVEPSPYDITSIIAILIWFVGGFAVHRSLLLPFILLTAFNLAGFAALMPYWNEPTPRLYQFQSLYLLTTFGFFAIYASQHTQARMRSLLLAYTLGSVLTSVLGLLSYFNLAGLGFLMPYEGRAAGTFKDPNLFGSYLILAANHLLQALVARPLRRAFLPACGFAIVMLGILFSFSRGSIAAAALSLLLVLISAFLTASTTKLRARIVAYSLGALAFLVVVLMVLVSTTDIGTFLGERAKLQDYDEGATGRFGNQVRSIPMLLERFWGFGPLRFRLTFDLEPHNSYIGAFANDGWIGGFLWIMIVVTTCVMGLRLMFSASPYRALAQVFAPAVIVFFLQGFQIDIDHWRQLFLCIGAVWGLEAARVKWKRGQRSEAYRPQPDLVTAD